MSECRWNRINHAVADLVEGSGEEIYNYAQSTSRISMSHISCQPHRHQSVSSFVYHRIRSLTQSVGAMLWSMAQLSDSTLLPLPKSVHNNLGWD